MGAMRRIVFGVPVPLLSKIVSVPQIGVRGISSLHLGDIKAMTQSGKTCQRFPNRTEQKGLMRQQTKSMFFPESRKRKTSRDQCETFYVASAKGQGQGRAVGEVRVE